LLEIISGVAPSILIILIVLIAEKVRRKRLIGRGDIKLMFVLGLHYNIKEMLFIALISCIITLVVLIIKKSKKEQGVAMSPMLFIGAWIISIVR